ncbi:hypothetical protein FB45DRAFT_946658 [Roridomyces roridus]|uniref:DUF6534 domain-containing protein n=1 Tax=Roridomyces roridus TaxID=1738132 RepID=A0AAD7FB60_9AGAR|nr:hypothetical protein FB45DRAFT_946658 [Roridomyces roridus]
MDPHRRVRVEDPTKKSNLTPGSRSSCSRLSRLTMSSNCTSNPTQAVINETFGALVAGLMVQQFFLGIIALQFGLYYRRFVGRDPRLYLYLVGALFVLNVFEAVTDFHVLYRTTVVHFGDYDFFDLQTWTMWAEPGLTALVGCVAQIFFMERCWKLTKKSCTVFILLSFLVLLSLGSGLAVSVSFFRVKLFSQLAKIPIPITFWLSSTAVTDMTIAAILSVALWRSKTAFKKTETVINRLVILTVETSLVTALIALLNLVLYFARISTAYHLYPQFSICRIYTITVLTTLLARDEIRVDLDGRTYWSSGGLGIGTGAQEGEIGMGMGVKVKVNTVIEHDSPSPAPSIIECEEEPAKIPDGNLRKSIVSWDEAV